MKNLFFIMAALFSSQLLACPNFTGEYVNEEFGTYYSISQDDCQAIQFHYDEGTIEAIIDGTDHLTSDYDVIVEDGVVLANIKTFENWSFKGNKLITIQKSKTTYPSGSIDMDKGQTETYLNKNNDLVTKGNDGQTIVDRRVK